VSDKTIVGQTPLPNIPFSTTTAFDFNDGFFV